MMSKTLFLAAVLGLAAFAAAEFPTEDGVLVLDDSNFDDALEAHDTLLVEFYAPWCGHCKKLAPEYSAAAAVLGEQDPPLFLAKVDAVANRDLGGRFDVQGFPTLKFFRNGKASEYGGGRTKKDIVQWVNKKSGPAAKTLDSADAAAAFVDASEVAVIGFFEDASSAEAKAFLAAAGANDDVAFGITTDADVAAANDASFPAVELFKKFDEGRASFSGDLTSSDDLEAFVAGNSLPLVIPFSQEMAPKIFGGKIKTHLLVMGDNDAEYFAELSESVTAVAKANKGKILVITVGLDSQRVMGYFGVTEDDLPTAVLVNMPEGGQMKKYLYTEDSLTETGLNALVDGYFAGDLKPFLKSADPPASNDEPVKVVVGTTFEEIVLDPSKDVLLEFYAPWCGHCKSLAPIYEELAERFEDVSSIVIAKMDATANEVDYEGVNVSGFPTLKFFPAGEDKKVVDYTGARELDDFVTFIEKHATEKFALDAEAEL